MQDLAEALTEALRPLIRRLVREEVERAKLQWRWQPVPKAAVMLGLTEKAVHTRCERGRLPCRKIDGRLYIDMAEVDRMLADSRLI